MSTTIGNYNVSLGLNVADLVDGSKLARNETAAVVRSLRSIVTPAEDVARKLNLLEKAFKEGAIEERIFDEAKRRLTASVQDNSAAFNANAEAIRRDNALIAEGERLTRSLMTVEERHAQELRRLKQLRDQAAIGETTYARAVAASKSRLAESQIVTARVVKTPPVVKDPLGTVHQQPGRFAAVSSQLSNLAAGYIGVYTAANFASGAIRKSADIERASAAYEVLTGSAEEAKDIISGVRDLAGRGISLTALNQSAQTMLSFNVASQSVIPALRQIAEITGGDAERMQRLSLAFSQVASNGRLMGEEVNQMVEAGFNPLQEISRTTGVSIVDLRKQMADGAISFEMVQDAFASVTAEGGRFNGMLERVGETTGGAINSAKATFESFQVSVGDALGPAMQALANDFKESAGAGSELVGIVRELSRGIADLDSGVRGISGRGILGTLANGLALSQTVGKQVNATLIDSLQAGQKLLSGDLAGAIEKTQDILTPTELIDDFLTKNLAAQQQAARAAGAMQEPTMGQQQTPAAELDPAKVAQRYNILQDSIKRAQGAAIPTLDNLRNQVQQQQRLSELAEERQDIEREADRIKEQSIEPAAKLADQFSRLDRMLELGINGITADMVAQEKSKLLTDSVKDIKIEQPQAITEGSAEAFKLITGLKNDAVAKQVKLAEEQRALAKAQVEAQKITNQKLDRLAEVSPRRAR